VLATLLVASCTTLSLDQQIANADQAVTDITTATDDALLVKLISPAQAQSVSTIVHQVNPLLDSARAASEANDPTNASKTLNLVSTLLAGLKAYVPPAPKQ
jgi:hypothetical protein